MRFVHTYWSKPALSNRWDVNKHQQIVANIWYYSLSVAYLKQLGQYIELHTDDFGKLCLDHIPYNNIYTDLNTVPDNIKPFMWAYGKFWGCKDLEPGYIHIDGDVFIKSQKTLDAIGYGHKVLVQGHEYVTDKHYIGALYDKTADVLKSMPYPEWSDPNCQHAYNVGTLQINDYNLKQRYFDTYFKYANYCCADPVISKKCSDSNGHYAPDLIFEQQWLYEICNNTNVPVKTLLYNDAPNTNERFGLSFMNSANAIDYQHVIGIDKYKTQIIYKCRQVLQRLDPTLYENTLRKVKYIKEYLLANYETSN